LCLAEVLTTSATCLSVNTHIAHLGAGVFVPLQTLERSVRLVEQLMELTDPADFPAVVLPELSELIGCDVITYNEVGTIPGQVGYEDWPPGALDPQTRETFARLVYQHPSIDHYRRTGDDQPVMISDFLTSSEFHRLELYADFFRPIPVEHQLSLSLDDAASTVVGIALNRTRHDFDDTDRAVLMVLRRPLLRAFKRARLRQEANGPAVLQLSARERTVMRLVAAGRTNASIAQALGVSPRTIAKHLEHIYRKLHVSNRAAAVARATSLD
jgi:DNA-binding CsgD family transcriptional regulator